MTFRAFYCCRSTGQIVQSADAYEIEIESARDIALTFLRDEGDFFGLIDQLGTIIQFRCEQDSVWVEIPSPTNRGSFGKYIEITDVRSLIESLPDILSPTEVDDLRFQPW